MRAGAGCCGDGPPPAFLWTILEVSDNLTRRCWRWRAAAAATTRFVGACVEIRRHRRDLHADGGGRWSACRRDGLGRGDAPRLFFGITSRRVRGPAQRLCATWLAGQQRSHAGTTIPRRRTDSVSPMWGCCRPPRLDGLEIADGAPRPQRRRSNILAGTQMPAQVPAAVGRCCGADRRKLTHPGQADQRG